MSDSWFIYATAARGVAEGAVETMYETLGGIVGEDLAEHLDPGEELEPPSLGFWPDISVSASTPVPTPAEARASLTEPGKKNVKFEEAALARLPECHSTIRIDGPQGFAPALVSAVRALFESLGPCVFAGGRGFDLSTSESLLVSLEGAPDLAAALRAVAAGAQDEDEDEEDEDEDDEEDDEEDEDDEPATDSARPEMLRMMLGEIASLPRVRRKAAELLGSAPPIVAKVADRLARIGAEPDPVVAKAIGVTERDVVGARKALATLLRRAEGR